MNALSSAHDTLVERGAATFRYSCETPLSLFESIRSYLERLVGPVLAQDHSVPVRLVSLDQPQCSAWFDFAASSEMAMSIRGMLTASGEPLPASPFAFQAMSAAVGIDMETWHILGLYIRNIKLTTTSGYESVNVDQMKVLEARITAVEVEERMREGQGNSQEELEQHENCFPAPSKLGTGQAGTPKQKNAASCFIHE